VPYFVFPFGFGLSFESIPAAPAPGKFLFALRRQKNLKFPSGLSARRAV
jgi:hypothetical protein